MSKKQFSRRSFVKSTALTGGVLLSSTFSLEAMANSSINKKLKLVLVGCGGRGTGAAVQALRADKDVELVAMADAFEDRLESSLKAISEELDGERNVKVKEKNRHVGFNSYQKVIDMADVVILATPPGFRPLHFKYAIDNDKHVFMEKPDATDAKTLNVSIPCAVRLAFAVVAALLIATVIASAAPTVVAAVMAAVVSALVPTK